MEIELYRPNRRLHLDLMVVFLLSRQSLPPGLVQTVPVIRGRLSDFLLRSKYFNRDISVLNNVR